MVFHPQQNGNARGTAMLGSMRMPAAQDDLAETATSSPILQNGTGPLG